MAAFLARLWEALTRRIDTFLFVVAMAISAIGLVTLYSATEQSLARIDNQIASLGVASRWC
ncbi:MAG: hypothetical protein H6Q02_2722 [Acidobacteria bacterium]|nr:hypothetical protein [Acidobacteriota bacterium]